MDSSNDTSTPVNISPRYSQELLYYEYLEYRLSQDLYIYVPPFLLALGTVGGIMILITMGRKSIRMTSSCDYFRALAVVDILVLYIGLMRYWLRALINVDIRKLSNWSCKLHYFSVYSLTHYSAWILVAVSIERFISVCFPFKARLTCTQLSSRITLTVLLVAIFGFNAHFFWTRGERVRTFGNVTSYSPCKVTSPIYYDFDDYIWPWIDFSLLSFVPAIVMIICSLSIVAKIYLANRGRVADLQSGAANRQISNPKMTTMTAMLLMTNTVFLLLTSPVVIFIILDRNWRKTDNSEHTEAVLYLASSCVILISYLNHAINFVLYCICGPRFRRELKAMFCKIRIYPQNDSMTLNRTNPFHQNHDST